VSFLPDLRDCDVRLVASDLDGTLVRSDGEVSNRSRAALARCRGLGVRVVLVTGRPPRWIGDSIAGLAHGDVAVCSNGAVLLDLAHGRILDVRPLALPVAREVVRRLEQVVPEAVFAVETLEGFRYEPGYRPHLPTRSFVTLARSGGQTPDEVSRAVDTREELLDGDPVVVKLLCRSFHAGWGPDSLLALAREVLRGLAEPVHSNLTDPLLEVSACGVDKATALTGLAALWQVSPCEVVAFGDMPNDAPMLRWAGRGYAMGNAHPEATGATDRKAPPCDEDGVAQILEQLIREGTIRQV
jgi:hydroxymethylpyrimidine pyrophosphatase-like HAD family hydrolase